MSLFRAIVHFVTDGNIQHWIAYVLTIAVTVYGLVRLFQSIDPDRPQPGRFLKKRDPRFVRVVRRAIDMVVSMAVLFGAGVIYAFGELADATSAGYVFKVSYAVAVALSLYGFVLTVLPLGAAIFYRKHDPVVTLYGSAGDKPWALPVTREAQLLGATAPQLTTGNDRTAPPVTRDVAVVTNAGLHSTRRPTVPALRPRAIAPTTFDLTSHVKGPQNSARV